jgi:glycerol-3-phosphate dehydrogenase
MLDLFVIGGGINGTGIANDAAGRGLSVVLCEQDDLANYTSSYSSKLIHGGLRYLEYYEFRLVREALIERDVLLKKAPFLIHPLSIVMPHNKFLRPAWMIRLGLFLYDHLNLKQTLPKSKAINLAKQTLNPLKSIYKRGFVYSDATVDDSRLVVLNAIQAKQNGAEILTRHSVKKAVRTDKGWKIEVLDKMHDETKIFYAKALVNAAGPWVDKILNTNQLITSHHIKLVKGSHIVLPKLYEGKQAYILQHVDRRIIFVIPYREQFTLIGTTDIEYEGDPAKASISDQEKQYLCDVVNEYFQKQIKPSDIKWSYAGVRPLQQDEHADPKKVTRDYYLEVDDKNGLPILSVFGGKITTYRQLALHALNKLTPYFYNMKPSWTEQTPLPGGNLEQSFESFCSVLKSRYPFIETAVLNRLAYAYGTRCYELLGPCEKIEDLGHHFGAGLYEIEVKFLQKNEWAQTVDDIIWRRTKLGLFLSHQEIEDLSRWLCLAN